jgi:hypothetical protein
MQLSEKRANLKIAAIQDRVMLMRIIVGGAFGHAAAVGSA